MFQPTGFSAEIFRDRYSLTPEETWEEACRRLSRQMSIAELPEKHKIYEDKFFDILSSNLFVPGGRIWYNSGRNNPNLLNCFVLGNQLDSRFGWGNYARELIVTSMAGGGCGTDFSDVRPRGASISGQKGECPGAVELMRLGDGCAKPVRAGGQRRVALMNSLDLDHPDVLEFIDAKLIKGELTHANVSVRSLRTKEFIKAIKNDGEWELSWKGKYKKAIKAKELWDKIVTNAYNSAEPGFLNWELVENESTIGYIEKLSTTNPCVAGDTEILTRDGYVRIDSVVDEEQEIWNGFEWSKVTPKVTGKNQPLIKVKTKLGKELVCTEYHKFYLRGVYDYTLTNHNYTIARQLVIGDQLLSWIDPETNEKIHDEVVGLEKFGVAETVYCFNEPKRHLGVFNGIITGQCGEIALSSYDCCCLGHLVLTRFISNDDIDYSLLGNTIRTSVRFLDNVLSVNNFPLPEMKDKSHKLRRIGLGTTGLADTLATLNIKYGSEEGNKFIDKLFRFISKQAYEASVMLAIEKGMFPACVPSKHVETGFMKRMPEKIKSLVLEHGIRNCAILTQAPTGTVSILSGNCSSGIESMFAPVYERRFWKNDKRQVELVFHPLFEQFMKEGRDVSHFVGAHDLNVRDHLEVQKTVQRHVDNAVSKTINLPENYPIEDMEKLWLEYLPYLKGTTFYRENTRGYVDEAGNKQEPPLKALSLEEGIKRFKEKHTVDNNSVNDCPTGVCEI